MVEKKREIKYVVYSCSLIGYTALKEEQRLVSSVRDKTIAAILTILIHS